MATHRDIIRRLGGPHAVARELAAHSAPPSEVAVRAWSMRDSIPGKYWAAFVEIADRTGGECSLGELAAAAAAPAEASQADAA